VLVVEETGPKRPLGGWLAEGGLASTAPAPFGTWATSCNVVTPGGGILRLTSGEEAADGKGFKS
jgi:hypothetical protein